MSNQTPLRDEDLGGNVITGAALRERMAAALGIISGVLTSHCGPYARFAVAPNLTADLVQDEFTRDGISIVRMLQFAEPVAQFCRSTIGFIGNKVDNACNDGTTTSMLFASALSQAWLSSEHATDGHVAIHESRASARVSVEELKQHFVEMFDYIKQSKLTTESLWELIKEADPETTCTLADVNYAVAMWAALTSTKGNYEIASKVTDAVLSYPPEFSDYQLVSSSSVEREELLVVDKQEANFSFEAIRSLADQKGNFGLGEIFDYPNSYITLSTAPLSDGVPATDLLIIQLQNMASGHHVLDAPWFIVSRELVSPALIRGIRAYNRTEQGEKCPIIPINLSYTTDLLRYVAMEAVACSAGDGQYLTLDTASHSFAPASSWIIPARAKMLGHTLEIYDLYEKTGGMYHPFYKDESKVAYNHLVGEIDKLLKLNASRKREAAQSEVDSLIYIKRCLIAQEVKDLRVGGLAHDNAANLSVVKDAAGTVMSVLEQGFILSGYLSLAALVESWTATPVTDAILKALRTVAVGTYEKEAKPAIDKYLAMATPQDGLHARRLYSVTAQPDGTAEMAKITDYDIREPGKAGFPIIQPAIGFEAQLRRQADILPKFLLTDSLFANTL